MVAAYHSFGDIINFSPLARKGEIGNRFRDTEQAQPAWPVPAVQPGKEPPVKTWLDRPNRAKPPLRVHDHLRLRAIGFFLKAADNNLRNDGP